MKHALLLAALAFPVAAQAQTAAPAPAQTPAPAPAPAPPTPDPAPSPAAAPPAPPPAVPADQVLIYRGEAASILGRNVRDSTDSVVGRIVDILVDDTGQPRAAVIDVGGFMGMGSRKVAVTWRSLRFETTAGRAGRITIDMTLDQIKDVPEFRRTTSPSDPPNSVAVPPPPRP